MREKGSSIYSGNFEVQKSAPLDAREIVGTLAELTIEATWLAHDNSSYAYKGMNVTVTNDGDNNGIYRLNGLPITVESNWVRVGNELATNEEYTEGIITTKSPSVIQVKTDINTNVENLSSTINNLSLPTLPSSRFLIVKDALNSSENNSMTAENSIITVKPITIKTNRDEEITITEKTFDVSTLANGLYYLYYDKDSDTVEYTSDFIVGAELPWEEIKIPFIPSNVEYSSIFQAEGWGPENLFDGDPDTGTVTNGMSIDEFIRINIDPGLVRGQFTNLRFTTRFSRTLPTLLLYGINNLEQDILLGEFSGEAEVEHIVDLSNYSVTDFIAFKIMQSEVSLYNFGFNEFSCYYKDSVSYTNGIFLNSGQYNFSVTKHNGYITTIPNITMLGVVNVLNGVVETLTNYPFMFNHFSTESINYLNTVQKSEFYEQIEIISDNISNLLATDEEWEAGTSVDKSPTVKQVKDSLDSTEGNVTKFVQAITNEDIIEGKITITHTLNSTDVIFSIYDELNELIIPDTVKIIDVNTIEVNLISFTPLAGNYKIVLL